ncbi:MAG: DUF1294 domain-containing protein [Bacillota bacterium]|nr:DUF1294 domain-containing protein [Bacillota bacterium]
METYIFYYYIIINIISFSFSGLDKIKAKKNKWRVKEKTLHTFSFLGGAYGSILSMIMFRHKTKKLKFKIITAVAFIIHTAIIGYWLYSNYFPSS